MTPLIGSLLAGAVTSAVRGLADTQPMLVLRPQLETSRPPRSVDRPLLPDGTVIKIELNFNL